MLTRGQKQTLAQALVGLYKMAGVHLTREQVAESLSPTPISMAISNDNLVIWTESDLSKEAIYDLSGGPVLLPRSSNGALPPGLLRPLDCERVLFANVPVTWKDWTHIWSSANGDRREWAYAVLPG
jgi:hypothetical protein